MVLAKQSGSVNFDGLVMQEYMYMYIIPEVMCYYYYDFYYVYYYNGLLYLNQFVSSCILKGEFHYN